MLKSKPIPTAVLADAAGYRSRGFCWRLTAALVSRRHGVRVTAGELRAVMPENGSDPQPSEK